MKITDKVIEAIKANQRLISLLALEFDCTETTVRRYLDRKDNMLTTAAAMRLISDETGIKQDKLLA